MNTTLTARRLVTNALDLLFPPRCLGCAREGAFLCAACRATMPPVPALVSGPQGPLEGIAAPFAMEGVAREAVHALKYRGLRALAPVMGELLDSSLQTHGVTGDLLIPVPLHPWRQWRRGYNQAELLAREVGRGLSIPMDPTALRRRRLSPPQARTASREERQANVAGAFTAQRTLTGLQVLILDDVTTTGATLQACAAALRDAGASRVWGVAFAREL